MFEKNLCSRWRERKKNYIEQQQLDDEEERQQAAQNEVTRRGQELTKSLHEAEKKNELNDLEKQMLKSLIMWILHSFSHQF